MQEAPIALVSDRVASKVGEESFVQVSRSKMAEKYPFKFFFCTHTYIAPCCACARGVITTSALDSYNFEIEPQDSYVSKS